MILYSHTRYPLYHILRAWHPLNPTLSDLFILYTWYLLDPTLRSRHPLDPTSNHFLSPVQIRVKEIEKKTEYFNSDTHYHSPVLTDPFSLGADDPSGEGVLEDNEGYHGRGRTPQDVSGV